MLNSKTRWIIQNSDETQINELVNQLGIPSLVAKLLVNRNLGNVEQARDFLFVNDDGFHDPFLFPDMGIVVDRIEEAIENEEKILIFGDYDADGVSSTSVMMTVLQEKGAKVEFYIPNRFTEGYGPNEKAFRWAADEGFSLIITVDTGIAAVHEAEIASELGIDLIITDHHEPGPHLPEALAIIHPKLEDSVYPFHELAGVGVAFKVAHALYGHVPEHLLDLAAIGTIADLVPLVGENRLIAKKGIEHLCRTDRLGVKALCKISSTQQQELTEESIGFIIAPRINAVGRLGDADPAVHLMLSKDEEEALELAQEIDSLNKERQTIVAQMTEEAVQMVEQQFPLSENQVLVIGKEGWNSGVVGIVASRLVEKYYRPTIVLSFDSEKGTAKGSARSIVGYDLFKSLSTCREILPHFGGHPMAAGMTLQLEDVQQLRDRLNQIARETLTPEDFIPVKKLDATISIDEIDLESIEKLQLLSPYGMSNPKPKILIENISASGVKQIGSNQDHLKMLLQNDVSQLDSVGFGLGSLVYHIAPSANLSVIGELSINEWNNRKKPQIFLEDVKVSDWQLFDVRGKHHERWLTYVPEENRKLIVFQKSTMDKLTLTEYENDLVFIQSTEDINSLDFSGSNLVFIDLPTARDVMESLIARVEPQRIYTHFFQEDNHFFSTIPTREHFKWYYAFLAKREFFDFHKNGSELAKYKGWSKETIEFMSKVFFELDFVTMDNGIIRLNQTKAKRDLSQSKTYQQKQAYIKLENELLYSSYHDLKSWFDQRMNTSVRSEEEVKAWI